MDKEEHLPLHMDKWSRNERLYKHLLDMGTVCTPVFADEGNTLIEALYVSAEGPLVPPHIDTPVKRSQIGESVTPSRGTGDNVVDFPPIL